MLSHIPASSDKTQPPNLDNGDKEKYLHVPLSQSAKPYLATNFEVNVVAPSPKAQEDEWVTGFKLFNIITAVALVCLLLLLDTSIVATVSANDRIKIRSLLITHQAIPRITSEFHSLVDVGWYGSAYQLARCVLHIFGLSSYVD